MSKAPPRVEALHLAEEAAPVEQLVAMHPYGDAVRTELLSSVLRRENKWITPEDITNQRAFVYLDGEAKVELCHRAGAPFTADPTHRLHDVQRRYLGRMERELLLKGGSRMGKSVLGGCSAFSQISTPHQRVAIIGDTYDHCYQEFYYAYQAFDKLFGPEAAVIYDCVHHGNQHKMQIDTVWGSTLQVFSVGNDYLDSIMGTEWDMVIAAEGSKIPEDIVTTKVWRALSGRAKVYSSGFRMRTGYLYVFSTPDGELGYPAYREDQIERDTRGKMDQMHFGAPRWNFDEEKWETTSWEESVFISTESVLANPAYSKEEFEAAKKRLGEDSPAFQEQYMGRKVRRTGVILNAFNRDKHQFRRLEQSALKQMRFGIGIDFGKNFGAVLIAQDPENRFYILGEVFSVEKLTSEDALEIKKMCIDTLGPLYAINQRAYKPEDIDAQWREVKKSIDFIFGDAASQSKGDIQFYLDHAVSFEGKEDLVSSFRRVNELFGSNRLLLSHDLFVVPDELKNLVWKPNKRGRGAAAASEVPSGARHCIDALRYIITPMMRMEPPRGEVRTYSFEEAYMANQLDGHLRKHLYGASATKQHPDSVQTLDELL